MNPVQQGLLDFRRALKCMIAAKPLTSFRRSKPIPGAPAHLFQQLWHCHRGYKELGGMSGSLFPAIPFHFCLLANFSFSQPIRSILFCHTGGARARARASRPGRDEKILNTNCANRSQACHCKGRAGQSVSRRDTNDVKIFGLLAALTGALALPLPSPRSGLPRCG